MLPQLAKVKGIALDLLFPRWCVGCGRQDEFIRVSCYHSLARIMPPLFPQCGRPQARTGTVAERRSNIADVFSCRHPRLIDKPVLLIDDVTTFEATLDACAKAVKANRASSVWALEIAREIYKE